MNEAPIHVYYDFVDPLSWLVFEQLGALPETARARLKWIGFELRPPPTPLTDIDHPEIASRWEAAREHSVEASEPSEPVAILAPPSLVPWTRKAHELVLHADEHDRSDEMRSRIFAAYVTEGVDIGRIDRLVELAVDVGLERTNTKAVLDVDRFDAAVAEQRDTALSLGIESTPTVEVDGERHTGFHDAALLRTFLGT